MNAAVTLNKATGEKRSKSEAKNTASDLLVMDVFNWLVSWIKDNIALIFC